MNALVSVTGTVRSFTACAYARWTGGGRGGPAGILTTFEGKPAVFATRIERIH